MKDQLSIERRRHSFETRQPVYSIDMVPGLFTLFLE